MKQPNFAKMSFLPDLAGWALSGGAGGGRDDENANNNNANDNSNNNGEPVQQETEEEIRAKRVARLAARLDQKKDDNESNDKEEDSKKPAAARNSTGSSPMDVDIGDNEDTEMEPAPAVAPVAPVAPVAVAAKQEEPKKLSPSKKLPSTSDKSSEPVTKKKRGKEPPLVSKLNPSSKIQRKKEMLLKKILNIKLKGGKVISSDCIEIDIGSTIVTEENIAEILALRLALPSSVLQSVSPKERNLIAYLAMCHKKAGEELKNTKSSSSLNDLSENEKLLNEIKSQVVSFAASSLMEPDLFALGKDGIQHLSECLTSASLDPSSSITIGVSGKNSSFYACLCEELYSQDQDAFETVFKGVASNICESLKKCDTIMDSNDGSGLVLVSALTALCSSKKAALVLTKIPNFLLPKAETPEANEKVSMPLPPPPANATPQQQSLYRMMIAMSGGNQKYLRRSGPGLEKETLLGLVMRLGTPMDNSSITSQFQNPARRNRSDIKKTTDNLRRQLKSYQDTVYSLVKALITAGEAARTPVCCFPLEENEVCMFNSHFPY